VTQTRESTAAEAADHSPEAAASDRSRAAGDAGVDPIRAFDEANERLDNYLKNIGFESMSADRILAWAASTFDADRIVLNTSFQATGVAMIHMVVTAGLDLRVTTIDTLRLPAETYAFLRQVEERYGIEIEVHRPDPEPVQAMTRRFGEYLFFDSKTLQEYCCHIRKVKPNDELLKTADCWISGIRRDQSDFRRDTPKAATVAEYGSRRRILKLNPLADWSDEQLDAFVEAHEVPRHPLYEQGYQSIGCVICSTPTMEGEDQRAGRWRWFNGERGPDPEEAKECGLHIPMYNI
jgi:phosphoadenosine phosphosulfate reductase